MLCTSTRTVPRPQASGMPTSAGRLRKQEVVKHLLLTVRDGTQLCIFGPHACGEPSKCEPQ